MTRVTLLHNPGSGSGRHSGDELVSLLQQAGFEPDYVSTKAENYAEALEKPGEFVIAAGGDGTVGRAARCLIGRAAPIAVLPLGTANNIAKALGLFGDVREILAGLAAARRIGIDVGFAKGPWGQRPFIEGAGLGFFPETMAALDRKKKTEKKTSGQEKAGRPPLERALRAMRQVAAQYDAQKLELAIDGEDFSGRYLGIEVMNLKYVGPNLSLADAEAEVVIELGIEHNALTRRSTAPSHGSGCVRLARLYAMHSRTTPDPASWSPDELVAKLAELLRVSAIDRPRLALSPLPRLIGHRGACAHAPENTLASIRKAAALGACWVEFDVRLTADGELAVIHDETVERTTDGRGRVLDLALRHLKQLDAGSWFGAEFAGERVPSLDQVIMLLTELGLGANIEIKSNAAEAGATAAALSRVLAASWPPDRPAPLVSSFELAALEAMQAAAPQWPRGLLMKRLDGNWRRTLARLDAATLNLDHRPLDAAAMAEARKAEVPILLYTVNDSDRARTLLSWGATAVFTDRPEIAAFLAMA